MTEKDVNGDFLSDYIKKIDQPGVAVCSWCNETIVYGSSDKKRLHSHTKLNKEKHLKNKSIISQNTTIPSSWIDPNKIANPSDKCSKPCEMPYGAAANIHDSRVCSSRHTLPVQPIYLLMTVNLILKRLLSLLLLNIPYHFQKFLSWSSLHNFYQRITKL